MRREMMALSLFGTAVSALPLYVGIANDVPVFAAFGGFLTGFHLVRLLVAAVDR